MREDSPLVQELRELRSVSGFLRGTYFASPVSSSLPNPGMNGNNGGHHVTPRDKSELGARLKRIAGQVGGIQRMLDDGRPLLEVVTQLSAVRAALGGVANIVLGSHVEERANEMLTSDSPRERRELVSEFVRLFEKRHLDM